MKNLDDVLLQDILVILKNIVLQRFDKKIVAFVWEMVSYTPIGSMYSIFTYIYHENQPFM